MLKIIAPEIKAVLSFIVFLNVVLANCCNADAPPRLTGLSMDKVVGKKNKEAKIPNLGEPYFTVTPKDLQDGLTVGELELDGAGKETILEIAAEIGANEKHRLDSLLIAYKGKLVFESYFRRGRVDVPHYQMSITKSYTAFALGRAMQLGYLKMEDLDKPIISFLPELDKSKLSPGAEKITLSQVLNMHSGVENQRISGEKRQAYVQALLSGEINNSPDFSYQGTDPNMIMVVIDTLVPGGAGKFLEKELLDKLRITEYHWGKSRAHVPKAAAGSAIRSRDMVKFGILMANGGKYKGEQLIPKAYMEKALSPIYKNPRKTYGFFCYHWTVKLNGETHVRKSCRGAGGQYIVVFPEHELVVVYTCHKNGMPRDLPDLAGEKILPAFIEQ